MIIDGYRFAKYLHDTGLTAEEFYLLYRVMLQEQNIANGILKVPGIKENEASFQFAKWSEIYQVKHSYYLDTDIKWLDIVYKLVDEGFVEVWNKDKNIIKLTEIKVTTKFKNYFLISDVEQAFYEFVKIYPSWVYVKGNKFPAMDLAPHELVKLYDQYILKGGNAPLHERCLLLTERFLNSNESKGAPYKISNYIINAYEGIAKAIEDDAQNDYSFGEEV